MEEQILDSDQFSLYVYHALFFYSQLNMIYYMKIYKLFPLKGIFIIMSFIHKKWKWSRYPAREENWDIIWGQEMERPHGAGMDGVSLATLLKLERVKKEKRDEKRRKK